MLRTRILTAVIGIPLMLAVIFAPGGGLYAFTLSLLALVAVLEYHRAYSRADWFPKPRPNWVLLGAGALMPLVFGLFPSLTLGNFLLPVFATALLYELYIAWRVGRLSVVPNIGYGIFGMFYIGWLFTFGVWLRNDFTPASLGGMRTEQGALWTLWLFAMLWLGDSAAYFTGKSMGKRKIATLLSPAKTLEGFIANLVLCMLVGWQGGLLLGLSTGWAIAAGLGVGVLGQLGDLFESALKRSIGVKDFGGVLPGHGGVLDRFDSFLFSAPWIWWIVQVAG
ncbi:MAG: phosphatidate cytidylyltransferase [Fimbriimonadales bacterium]|nr:MAG: phosphatidate cytidylyltransferase [Fimbriimonadales bacterium]